VRIVAVLECPFCYEALQVEPPDKIHSAFSVEQPIKNSYHGDIVKKKVKCKSCQETLTLYWYAPLEYFNRI